MNSQFTRLSVNLLKRDKDVLARIATREGETMSTIIRRLVRQEGIRLGLYELEVGPGLTTDDQPREGHLTNSRG